MILPDTLADTIRDVPLSAMEPTFVNHYRGLISGGADCPGLIAEVCRLSPAADPGVLQRKIFSPLGEEIPGGNGAAGPEEGEAPPASLDSGLLPDDIDTLVITPRQWIIEGRLLKGTVSALVGTAGAGKSAFEIASAMATITGEEYTGERIAMPGASVWIYNNEEDKDELIRRYLAFCRFHGLTPSKYRDKIRLSTGYGAPLVIAKKSSITGYVIPTPRVNELIEKILEYRVDVFSVDPVVSTHQTEENSNTDAEQVMTMWRHIAKETGAAINLPAHTPKIGGESDAEAGNANMLRGASSVIGAVRQVHTLCRMGPTTAKNYGISEGERIHLVRLDPAKGNYSPPVERATWLQMHNHCLENDPEKPDWVGVFDSYPDELSEVEGIREGKKDANKSKVDAAILNLALHPGQTVALSEVIDRLSGSADLSKTTVRDYVPRVIPERGSAEDNQGRALYSWSKGNGTTGKIRLHRAPS